MTTRIVWTEPARHNPAKLDKPVGRRVAAAILRLAEPGRGDVARLRPPLDGHRLRVGDWRVLVSLGEAAATSTVRRIRHRREAYANP